MSISTIHYTCIAHHVNCILIILAIYIIDFTHDRRKCASSLEGTNRLPEDDKYVPKHVGAKNQRNKKLDAFVGHFMNTFYDVRTTTKSPNDAFLRTYPRR
jgi:hypothetical protein